MEAVIAILLIIIVGAVLYTAYNAQNSRVVQPSVQIYPVYRPPQVQYVQYSVPNYYPQPRPQPRPRPRPDRPFPWWPWGNNNDDDNNNNGGTGSGGAGAYTGIQN